VQGPLDQDPLHAVPVWADPRRVVSGDLPHVRDFRRGDATADDPARRQDHELNAAEYERAALVAISSAWMISGARSGRRNVIRYLGIGRAPLLVAGGLDPLLMLPEQAVSGHAGLATPAAAEEA